MADYDVLTFAPHNGGQGLRIAVTSSASTPAGIQVPDSLNSGSAVRVRVANLGDQAAYVNLIGTASLSNMAILAGTVEVFALLPGVHISISAITETGTTTLSVVAGTGT